MNDKKTIAIIGYGYVGKAVYNFFKTHFHVIAYDPLKIIFEDGREIEKPSDSELAEARKYINKVTDLAVLCVPTPMSDNGSCDTSYVESSLNWLKTKLVLIKSTIPPTTTQAFCKKYKKKICFSPEYIGEGNYMVPFWKDYPDPLDMKKHNFVIVGGEKKTAGEIMEFFKPVLGAEAKYVKTDSTTAELCKYIENAFLATKVTFCNEFYNIAEAYGVDYDELREMWLLDGRVGRSHTAVFKNKRGFSGKCLPKDTNAIYQAAKKHGYTPDLLASVISVNKKIRGEK